jgi:anti-sigma factor RsiW
MTCRELTDFLADYVAGALEARVRRAFEAHLAECPGCIAYLRGYRATIALAKASAAPADCVPSDGIPDELIDAILAARRRRGPA